jgi:choline kinase
MILVIPAAGRARRLKPLSDTCPKNLLRIGQKTILQIQLETIPLNKITKIIFILGFMGEKVKNHIASLEVNLPISYYVNDDYLNSNCAYSLMSAREDLNDGFMLLNCDLITTRSNLEQIIDSTKANVVGARKTDSYTTDLQKAIVKNGVIQDWSDNLKNADSEIMGPLKISPFDFKKILQYYDSLSLDRQKKLHCFSLFSSCRDIIDYYPLYFEDSDWKEIDNHNDLQIAKKLYEKFIQGK